MTAIANMNGHTNQQCGLRGLPVYAGMYCIVCRMLDAEEFADWAGNVGKWRKRQVAGFDRGELSLKINP